MRDLSGTDVIQSLQEYRINAGRLPSKFYIDFDKRIIGTAAYKWVLENGSKTAAAPVGCQSQNDLVERTWISLL